MRATKVDQNLYTFKGRSLQGKPVDFAAKRGHVFLIVNTASACGFTPQYKGLEALWQAHRDRGLIVVGFPCNQFGEQEQGGADAIAEFCELNHGVTFPLMEKGDVNGPKAPALWRWLSSAAPGALGSEAIKWNFTKFLVGRDGHVVKRYAPTTQPEAIEADIKAALDKT